MQSILYAIGGMGQWYRPLASMERISIAMLGEALQQQDAVQHQEDDQTNHEIDDGEDSSDETDPAPEQPLSKEPSKRRSGSSSKTLWTKLNCKLTEPREACAAVSLFDRYIVVLGGRSSSSKGTDNSNHLILCTVDIVDTVFETVYPGPRLDEPRWRFGAAVLHSSIHVVGGSNGRQKLSSVQTLQCYDPHHSNTTGATRTSGSLSDLLFGSSPQWTTRPELALNRRGEGGRSGHAVTRLGSCLVVVGGQTGGGTNNNTQSTSVENAVSRGSPHPKTVKTVDVLDPQRGGQWQATPLPRARYDCTVVALAHRLVVVGGLGSAGILGFSALPSLALYDKQDYLKVRQKPLWIGVCTFIPCLTYNLTLVLFLLVVSHVCCTSNRANTLVEPNWIVTFKNWNKSFSKRNSIPRQALRIIFLHHQGLSKERMRCCSRRAPRSKNSCRGYKPCVKMTNSVPFPICSMIFNDTKRILIPWHMRAIDFL